MFKLEKLYSSTSSQPLSSIPEVVDLQRESIQIELAKIAHTHYLLRREHPHLSHSKLPLSPGIVIHKPVDYYTLDTLSHPYPPRFKLSPSYSSFFSRALAHANDVYVSRHLAFVSHKLSHTYTHTDALVLHDYLSAKQPTQYYYDGSGLTHSDLEPFAIHFKVDIIITI